MSLSQLLSIFTPIEAKLPESIKPIVGELKHLVELLETVANLKKSVAVAKEDEIPDLQKMLRETVDESKVYIEILRQDISDLLTNPAYNNLLIKKKSLTYWLSQIILELVRIQPQNERINGEYCCPILFEPVTPDSFPLMDGYLYTTDGIVRWFTESKKYNYPQRNQENAPLSNVDKIAVMTAQGKDIPEEVIEDPINLDEIEPPKPAAPKAATPPPQVTAPIIKAPASVQQPPVPVTVQAQPVVQVRPQVPLPPIPAVTNNQPSATHEEVSEIITQLDRVHVENTINVTAEGRQIAESELPNNIYSLSGPSPTLWNKIKNVFKKDEEQKHLPPSNKR